MQSEFWLYEPAVTESGVSKREIASGCGLAVTLALLERLDLMELNELVRHHLPRLVLRARAGRDGEPTAVVSADAVQREYKRSVTEEANTRLAGE